jgi:phosphopantothenate---cysteine ligase (CTP)
VKVLVTAGNTRIPIDKVRGIDNVFKGRTGAAIAKYFAQQRCDVTLFTSHPEFVELHPNLLVVKYENYDHLVRLMENGIRNVGYDVVIHSAAVADYKVDGVYTRVQGSITRNGNLHLELAKLDSYGKIASNHPELWMKQVPTMKIVDQIREPWGFKGTLVKFKLQVGMEDSELIKIATASMKHSRADLIVANTLENMNEKAFIISAKGGNPLLVRREVLPVTLYEEIR